MYDKRTPHFSFRKCCLCRQKVRATVAKKKLIIGPLEAEAITIKPEVPMHTTDSRLLSCQSETASGKQAAPIEPARTGWLNGPWARMRPPLINGASGMPPKEEKKF